MSKDIQDNVVFNQQQQQQENNNLFSALCRAQSQLKEIPKKAQGYGYKYAPLEEIWSVIRAPLTENGLCVIQKITTDKSDGKSYLVTILAHGPSGEVESSEICIPSAQSKKMNEIQALGASITYIRRYALSALLSLTTEEDTDAKDLSSPAKTTTTTECISKSLADQVKAKAMVDEEFSKRTNKLRGYFGVTKIEELPKVAEKKLKEVLDGTEK